MLWGKHKKKTLSFSITFALCVIGTYNAVVINSESNIDSLDAKFVKRLDEFYGVVTPARQVATSSEWQKIDRKVITEQIVTTINAAPVAVAATTEEAQIAESAAAVQEELELSLVEVINPNKYKEGLTAQQFSGNLSTNNGIIENLAVALPNSEGISVSFSEMTGNVFEYDLEGEVYSGMMYQVDQNSYMVTLSNGPLEGTRLRFSNMAPVEQQVETQEFLAETHQVEVGNFGQPESEIQTETATQNL